MKIDLNTLQVIPTSRRRYGSTFYTYATANLNGQNFDLGDPFPSSNFPKYEAAMSILIKLQQKEKVIVSETQFRQLFKGIKEGKEKYSMFAEKLESLGVTFE